MRDGQQERPPAGLTEAYLEADRELRLLYTKIGCVLSVVLMPAGASLDLFVYPGAFWELFRIRAAATGLIAVIFGLHFTRFGYRNVRGLGMWLVLANQAALSWMIFETEGAASPYYAGLNLIFLGAAVLLPFTFGEALILGMGTLCLYLAACLLHHHRAPVDYDILFNNVYFIVLTGVICLTSSHFRSRRRFEDFRLRHELDVRNRELARSYEQLAQIDQLKSQFFANVSHELRTPLTLILSPVEDLLHRAAPLAPAVRDLLAVVRDNGLRLLKLINDLLELVRLEEGRSQMRRQSLDLDLFVPGITNSVAHLAAKKGLMVRMEGAGGPLVVEADRGRLEKVLLNLLMNAIKFTPAPGTISVRWRKREAEALVEVVDTGIGIAEKDLPFVFDRFRQADGSATRRYQGSGIGLALARELVEEHGGRIEAESEIGQGTALRLCLPLAEAGASGGDAEPGEPAAGDDVITRLHREADHFLPAEGGDPAQALPVLGTGRHIVLVVEDEPDMRRFLATSLASEYRVLQAADGRTGLALTREHRPELVVLDLMLPGMDGLAVCEAIKAGGETRGTKVVLVTARTDEEAKITALDRGADDFLLKPFSTAEVRTRLRNLLRAGQLEEDLRQRNAELEEALARLRETEAQLVQTEKMNALGSLAAGLLHEINNPLNYTLTALQLAQESLPPGAEGDLAEILDDIGEGMGRVRDIVSDLRSFAHPAAEGLKERFGLGACLDTALRLAAREADGVSVVRELEPGAVVEGSRTQVTHLLLNLLTNACQALRTDAGDRERLIRVSARAEKGRLRVRVWDNGGGIPPEDLDRIFNPFFTTRPVGDGMGLGLSICHTIVKNHGGVISARSEPGRWTELTFDLPLAPQET